MLRSGIRLSNLPKNDPNHPKVKVDVPLGVPRVARSDTGLPSGEIEACAVCEICRFLDGIRFLHDV